MRKYALIYGVLLFRLLSGGSFTYAQEWSGGAKIGYLSPFRGKLEAVVGNALVKTTGTYDGYRVSAFVRRDYKRWYWQPEISYSEAVGGGVFMNLYNLQTDGNQAWNITHYMPQFRRAEFTVIAGWKPLKRMRLYTGLQLQRIFLEKSGFGSFVMDTNTVEPQFRKYTWSRNEKNLLLESVENSYRPWVVNHPRARALIY